MILMQRYAKTKADIDAMEEKVKALKTKFAEMEPRVVEYMERHGLKKVSTGGRTIYLARKLWASVNGEVPKEEAIERMKNYEGTAAMVKEAVNAQTLSSYVRELPRDPSTDKIIFPPEIEGCIKVSEQFRAKVRKS